MNKDDLKVKISGLGYHVAACYEILNSFKKKDVLKKSSLTKDKEVKEMFFNATEYIPDVNNMIDTIENHISKQEKKDEEEK